MAIFLASTAAIGVLWSVGSRASLESRFLTQAVLRCESKLAEVLTGVEPWQNQSQVPFADDPRWIWSTTIFPTDIADLEEVEVTVQRVGATAGERVQFSLRRWQRDPLLFDTGTANGSNSQGAL